MPNRRSQDGEKREWLCWDCEQLFSSYETPFATKIFHPYDLDRSIKVRHGEWMLKFCASVAWRSLSALQEDGKFQRLTEQQAALGEKALETWSRFLLGRYKHTGDFELHVLTFGEIESASFSMTTPNINRYLARAIDMDLAANSSTCFSYSKLGPFAVFGFVQSHPGQWKGTRIPNGAGWFQPRSVTVPKQLWDYLNDRALHIKHVLESISPAQQQKIVETLRANPERFLQSGLFRAMQRDVEMFGRKAFGSVANAQDNIEKLD
ncbi:hypothetical protein V1290_005652 [Bradyrhizobium sp. AZCC 1578]|uniref:hypothetical protein n=1 Tax=Bradyrhizobium sp. AZCC 1578 TaxID=3117027 RepID=UPI002FF039BD